MSYTRDNLLTYFKSEFHDFALAAKAVESDAADNRASYHEQITNTWLKLGVPYADRLTTALDDTLVEVARVVGSVYALRRFARVFGAKPGYNTAPGSISEQYRSVLTQVLDLLARAEAEAIALGVPLGTTATKSARRITLRSAYTEGRA